MRQPSAPLRSVDWPQIAVLIGPCVPNVNILFGERTDVRIARQEPNQFTDDAAEEDALCHEKWKALAQIEAELRTKDALRTRSCAITARRSILEYGSEKIEILLLGMGHGMSLVIEAHGSYLAPRIGGLRKDTRTSGLDNANRL